MTITDALPVLLELAAFECKQRARGWKANPGERAYWTRLADLALEHASSLKRNNAATSRTEENQR